MYRILYVDDEPGLLEIGKIFLEQDGTFAVDTLPSASDALARLESTRYDAVVSDFLMPGIDGIVFLKQLRGRGDTTPFIIFTGRGREEVVIEALNSGADFYLQKGGDPHVQFAELMHKLRHAIQRRYADLALKKSERDYRHLIESANEVIFVIQDRLVRMINKKGIELSGYSEKEMLNELLTKFVHPDDRRMIVERNAGRIAGKELPSRYRFRILRKDNAIRWFELNTVAFDWNDRPATLNFMTDITDRRIAEEALRESEERYRLFFKTTLDGVFITDHTGKFIDFNDSLMAQLAATDRREISAVNSMDLFADTGERDAYIALVQQEGHAREYPIRFRRLNGTVFDALATVVLVKNPDGSVKSYIGTVRDLTGKPT